MGAEFIVTMAQQSIKVLLLLTMPLMGVALVIGLIISIFQAATQLQEMTLTFIPKIVAIFLALLFLSPWMLMTIMDFTREIFMNIPNYVR